MVVVVVVVIVVVVVVLNFVLYYCSFSQHTARNFKLSQGLDGTVRSISSPILHCRKLIIRSEQ